VPLLYVRDADKLVICNVNPGFERPNPWTLNLRAHPEASVQIRGDIVPVVAREATAAELDTYWPRLVKVWPAYESFLQRGGERSVFILEPAPTSLGRPDALLGAPLCVPQAVHPASSNGGCCPRFSSDSIIKDVLEVRRLAS
jgi:deazaflavin-dependent oxidoreductase (nitroreductase family)